MSDPEIDPDLVSMLEGDEALESPEEPPEPPENNILQMPPQPIIPSEIPVNEPIIIKNVQKEKPKNELLNEVPEEDKLGIKKLVIDFGRTADQITQNYEKDRKEVGEALSYFSKEVKDARAAGQKLPQAFIDGWVKLLAVKSEINTNATSVLDSVAKLLASAKNNNIIINMGENQETTINLESLLSQDHKEDEA
jgi:hypothetical protein